jgi:deoxyribodipyrimidine photo-lyase
MNQYGVAQSLQQFEPTRAAALERIARLNPRQYARTRNRLDGATSGLSPYITHGLTSVAEVIELLARRTPLDLNERIVAELAWREFFQHELRLRGAAVLDDLGPPPWGGEYARLLPPDIRHARCGVPAIDTAVRVLYGTGHLHNHARLWLASYVVHMRKVHWRVGADWMIGHLLDGDLASNHLSWQWVAGTFAAKPYVFNAEVVAKFAPALAPEPWDCRGSAIDRPYAAMQALAASAERLEPQPSGMLGVAEPPPLLAQPPAGLLAPFDAARIDARAVELVHPFALGDADEPSPSLLRLGVVHLPFHQRWPWSERRWRFVLTRMRAACDTVFVGDLTRELREPLKRAASVRCRATAQPVYAEALAELARVDAPRPAFVEPARPCPSFSRYFAELQKLGWPRALARPLPGSG